MPRSYTRLANRNVPGSDIEHRAGMPWGQCAAHCDGLKGCAGFVADKRVAGKVCFFKKIGGTALKDSRFDAYYASGVVPPTIAPTAKPTVKPTVKPTAKPPATTSPPPAKPLPGYVFGASYAGKTLVLASVGAANAGCDGVSMVVDSKCIVRFEPVGSRGAWSLAGPNQASGLYALAWKGSTCAASYLAYDTNKPTNAQVISTPKAAPLWRFIPGPEKNTWYVVAAQRPPTAGSLNSLAITGRCTSNAGVALMTHDPKNADQIWTIVPTDDIVHKTDTMGPAARYVSVCATPDAASPIVPFNALACPCAEVKDRKTGNWYRSVAGRWLKCGENNTKCEYKEAAIQRAKAYATDMARCWATSSALTNKSASNCPNEIMVFKGTLYQSKWNPTVQAFEWKELGHAPGFEVDAGGCTTTKPPPSGTSPLPRVNTSTPPQAPRTNVNVNVTVKQKRQEWTGLDNRQYLYNDGQYYVYDQFAREYVDVPPIQVVFPPGPSPVFGYGAFDDTYGAVFPTTSAPSDPATPVSNAEDTPAPEYSDVLSTIAPSLSGLTLKTVVLVVLVVLAAIGMLGTLIYMMIRRGARLSPNTSVRFGNNFVG